MTTKKKKKLLLLVQQQSGLSKVFETGITEIVFVTDPAELDLWTGHPSETETEEVEMTPELVECANTFLELLNA